MADGSAGTLRPTQEQSKRKLQGVRQMNVSASEPLFGLQVAGALQLLPANGQLKLNIGRWTNRPTDSRLPD